MMPILGRCTYIAQSQIYQIIEHNIGTKEHFILSLLFQHWAKLTRVYFVSNIWFLS